MRIFAVTWKEIIHIIRDRRSLILTFIFPAFTITFLGYAITLDITRVKVGLIEEDKIVGEEIKRQIEGSPYFRLIQVSNLREGEEYLKRGKISVLVNLRKGTYAGMMRRHPIPVEILLDGSDNNSASIAQGYLFHLFQGFRKRKTSPVFKFLYNPELNSRKFFVPGLIGILLFVLSVAMTSLAVVREKERGTMESLLVSPLKSFEIIGGKIFPYIVIGMCNFLIAIFFAYLLFGVKCEGSFLSLFLMTFLFLATGISIGVLISTFTESTMVAWLISFLITVLPSLILSDFVFSTRSMPPVIELFSWLVPTKYYIKTIRFIMLKGTSIFVLWKEVLPLLSFLTISLTLSILRLRREFR